MLISHAINELTAFMALFLFNSTLNKNEKFENKSLIPMNGEEIFHYYFHSS